MQALDTIKGLQGKLGLLFRKCIFSVLSVGPIPTHIAFIMDGNRRYAQRNNLKGGSGYRVGLLTLITMLKYCYELGVKYVTVYAFSVDNFKRQPEEVKWLMNLMQEKIEELLEEEGMVKKLGVRLHFIGNLKLLDEATRAATEKAMAATANNDNIVLLIYVAYTSTDEIVHAVKKCYNEKLSKIKELELSGTGGHLTGVDCDKDGHEFVIKLSDIERNMYMSVSPEPDIIVRTSGATRLSNFLLWQTTNSYLYSTAALWPEISLWHLVWMVLNFQRVQPTLEKQKKQL